jgi:protein-disulfide isomerase
MSRRRGRAADTMEETAAGVRSPGGTEWMELSMKRIVRRRVLGGSAVLAVALCTAFGGTAHAQDWKATTVNDTSALQPPAGSKVAIVEFMDLECPVCAQMDPIVEKAASDHHVAWVHHDFPLPYHNWSFAAAVNARYFDSKSPVLGNEYRAAVFANQNSIDNVPVLAQFTQKFANEHHIDLPFLMDPGGKFDAEVKADRSLAQRMGIDRTPSIWVVAETPGGPTYAELLNRNGLDELIEKEQAKVGPVKTPTAKKHAGE